MGYNLNINAIGVGRRKGFPLSKLYLSGKKSDITLNGSNISQVDSVKGLLVATQSTALNQPVDTAGSPYSIGDYQGNDYLIINDVSDLDFTTEFSIFLWIKRSALSAAYERIVTKYNTTGNQRSYQFYITNANRLEITLSSDGTATDTINAGNVFIDDLEWHFIGVTYNAGDLTFYIDSTIVEKTSTITSIYQSTSDVLIGLVPGTTQYFVGLMDEVIMNDKVYTSREISTIKKAKLGSNDFINDINQLAIVEIGQSNQEGRDGDIPLHTITEGGMYYDNVAETLDLLTNDRGDAQGGSHSTYFADRLFTLGGVTPVMIEKAEGGSALTATASAAVNWSDTSTKDLRGIAKTGTDALLSLLNVRNPIALWSQGEADAMYMDSHPSYTKAIAKAAMQDVIDWWFGLYPNSYFLISQIGKEVSGDTTGYLNMRNIQTEIVSENSRVYMASTAAFGFVALGYMIDNIHYDYRGNKVMGEDYADEIITILAL